jgi:preprotein translocase subunit SecE
LAGILKKTQKFTEDVQVEMRRVTWPDRDQVRNATGIILVFVIILALIIGAMDSVFAAFVRFVVNTFGG